MQKLTVFSMPDLHPFISKSGKHRKERAVSQLHSLSFGPSGFYLGVVFATCLPLCLCFSVKIFSTVNFHTVVYYYLYLKFHFCILVFGFFSSYLPALFLN